MRNITILPSLLPPSLHTFLPACLPSFLPSSLPLFVFLSVSVLSFSFFSSFFYLDLSMRQISEKKLHSFRHIRGSNIDAECPEEKKILLAKGTWEKNPCDPKRWVVVFCWKIEWKKDLQILCMNQLSPRLIQNPYIHGTDPKKTKALQMELEYTTSLKFETNCWYVLIWRV